MTGLEREIEFRKQGKQFTKNEIVSYSGISKILDVSYATAKNKVKTNKFKPEESIRIFETIFKPTEKQTKYDAYKYLFTEQGE